MIARSPARPRHRPRRPARDRVRPHRGPAGLRELPARVPREPAADASTGRATRAAATSRQRDDDTEEAVERRLELYERETVPIIDYYRDARPADDGRRRRRGRRRVRAPGQGRRRAALVAVLADGPAQDAARRSRSCGAPGAVVAEMHEACTRAAVPGATTADLDRAAREVLDRRARPLELPRLPRLPGGGVHLAERGDRARHPRRPGAGGRATSSRSTAGRSSRAGTPTPRSRCRSGEVDAESQRLMDVTRAALDAAIAATVAGQPARRHRRRGRAAGQRRPASGWSASTSATASAPPCTRSPTSRTTGPAGRGLKLRAGIVLAIEPMVTAGRATTRTLDDGWTVVTADGSRAAHFEHTVAITDDGPEDPAPLPAGPSRRLGRNGR